MKRLFLLLGLLLAVAIPNFAQTKTDTIYFEFDIDPNADSSEFVYEFSYIRDGIEVDYYDGQNHGRFKADAREQRMPVYGKGYWRIYCTQPSYSVWISQVNIRGGGDIRIREYGVYLTSLDLSRCTTLTELYCIDNQLTTLDLSRCPALTALYCVDNQLEMLDVSGCTALTTLSCGGNQLTTLDLSRCTTLTALYCADNQLTTLDLSRCTTLTTLQCDENQLTSLDVSGCTALGTLNCNDNQLTVLDISHNTALTSLGCSYNQLKSLNVSHTPALTSLGCSYNQLKSLDVSHNPTLTFLACNGNKIKDLDVSYNTILRRLYCHRNKLTDLDISHNIFLTDLRCYNNHIPLSMLYKAYTQNDQWNTFDADQIDTIFIQCQQLFDLSSERVLGETVSIFEITDGSGQTLSSDAWTEQDFIFHFHENGLYKLTLQNPSIINHYLYYDSLIETPITFTWHISVVDELPDDVANESQEADNLRIYAQGRTIYLSENRGLVQVFNTLGQCVYSGTATAIPVRMGGLYIVKVGTHSHKVLVR